MRFDVLTLFPGFFEQIMSDSIIGNAREKGIIEVNTFDIRDFTLNKHRKVDDYPYGGGGGMIMTAQPIYDAYMSIANKVPKKPHVIYMSPQGRVLSQDIAKSYRAYEHIILLCGHYEGIDQRIIDEIVDEEISIGDFVLTGGELPAMVFIDCVSRLVPGVLSSDESYIEESHYNGMLEYPQYTRPADFNGRTVPDVLLSGHHQNIKNWQRKQSLLRTQSKRPDLFEKLNLTKKDLESMGD